MVRPQSSISGDESKVGTSATQFVESRIAAPSAPPPNPGLGELLRLSRSNIGPRLAFCFFVIVALMLAGDGLLLWQFHLAHVQGTRLTEVGEELIAVSRFQTDFFRLNARLDDLAKSRDIEGLEKGAEPLRSALLGDIDQARNVISHLATEVHPDPTILPTLEAIQSMLPSQLEKLTALAEANDWEAVRLRLANEKKPLEAEVSVLVRAVEQQVSSELAAGLIESARVQHRILIIVPLTALFTSLVAAFLGLVVTRSITRPLARLVAGSRALAKGDFSHRIQAEGDDELATLGEVFNDMIVRLQELYRDVRRSEARWRSVFENSAVGVALTDLNGRFIATNPVFQKMVGYSDGELQKRCFLDITHEAHRENNWTLVEELLEGKQRHFQIEKQYRRKDGNLVWVRNHVSLAPGSEQAPRFLMAIIEDITERKEAEEALKRTERNLAAIIDTIPTTALTTCPDGYCDFLNQAWLDYTGMTAEQAQGWDWAEAIHPDDRKKLVEEWQACLASGRQVDTEARIRRLDGSYRWFLIRANPLRDESGNILKWYGTCTDIEDRKRGEEALRARELSWRQIVDNIPGLVATTGALGEVEFLNHQTLEYFGKTNEDLKNWALIGAVHPDDLPHVIEVRKKSIETGQIYEVEHRCRRADGVYRWFQVRGLPVRDAENKVTAWYLLLTDINDRKKAEEALQSSERNLRLIINVIPTYIHVLRDDGSVLYVNPAVLDYTGLTLEEVQRENYRDRVFHPEDVERLREERRKALTRAVPFENEQRVLGKDGRYRWFLIRYNPLLDEQGKIDRWYVAATDIDDRKRAEAQVEQAYLRLAEAQRLSKTGSFITDLVADEHNWSEETFRIFEFDPATKVTVQRIRDIIHPEDLPSFDAMIARAMTGADVDFVFRTLTSLGAVKHIRGMARIMVQNADRPLFIGALQDITESKVAEEALDKARSELAHVARVTTLNALTASIAHEINQPLASLVTNASICLRRLNVDPPNVDGARETVQRTIRDANRASDVITRLRALFSRKEFTLETLDLNEITTEVIALSLSDLQRNRVILRSELAEDLPSIIGDRVQLQQVTLNLLRNASDAMVGVDDRPRLLLIRTQREGNDRVRLSVQDAGCGVNPHDFERLFEAFYTTKSGGMGIGLSLSRSIIEKHHGRLWAEPNHGPGSTFSFSLPQGPNSAKDAAA